MTKKMTVGSLQCSSPTAFSEPFLESPHVFLDQKVLRFVESVRDNQGNCVVCAGFGGPKDEVRRNQGGNSNLPTPPTQKESVHLLCIFPAGSVGASWLVFDFTVCHPF